MTGAHVQGKDATERNRIAIRFTVVLIIVVVLVFGFIGLKLVQFGDDLKQQADDRHTERVQDQARTDRQIAQLACLVVSQTNEDAKGFDPSARAAIKRFRAFYGCPPYSAATARDPFSKAAQPHPTKPVPTGFVPSDVPGAPAPASRTTADANRTPAGAQTSPSRSPRTSPPKSVSVTPKPSPSTKTSTPAPIRVCPSFPVLGHPICVKVG